ncbi:protein S100-A16-like [Hemicordylus capensis]|uniref:protein S100-A16-like n=1 Tax=Hemicordylus capensis TaxID=884348 RepID=UPI002303A903|nr:protein S100-A16-like [Hemicordylus capensis]
MAGNLSELEPAIQVLVDTYDQYAGKDLWGKRRSAIRKKDFQKLLRQELNHMLTDTENKEAAARLTRDLDKDSDGKISFEEYWNLLGEIVHGLLECRIANEK